MTITDMFDLNVIDPCLTTVLSDAVIPELLAFGGYTNVTGRYDITDSASEHITQLHPTVIEFCGPIEFAFFCNETETDVISGANNDVITF